MDKSQSLEEERSAHPSGIEAARQAKRAAKGAAANKRAALASLKNPMAVKTGYPEADGSQSIAVERKSHLNGALKQPSKQEQTISNQRIASAISRSVLS